MVESTRANHLGGIGGGVGGATLVGGSVGGGAGFDGVSTPRVLQPLAISKTAVNPQRSQA
jgi:hypothetical protein